MGNVDFSTSSLRDICYHDACDTLDRSMFPAPFNGPLDLDRLLIATRTQAIAVLTYAMSTETLNGMRGKGNFSPEMMQSQIEKAFEPHPDEAK